ncbi:uncharacterized protein LOC118187402 [Stegodyphus dumicola]|uniref:uncharacterized protein LOC118187402 n=1 Tax=Stegodyphus dumicola TaxID=202533 RepID=UPI0015A9F877|nr:uncharacterized protein LOC118187402 [Stegodyphus dumicola]
MADVQLTARWTVSETIALIEIWGCDSIQKKLDGTVRDTEIYRQIQKELSDAGYSRNTVQIKTKVKALRREYRLQRDKLRLSGAGGKITFRFYHEMDKVLGSRDASNPGLITETEILGLEESVPSEMLNTSEESFLCMDHQGTEMYEQSQECSPIPPTPSSHFSSLNGQRSFPATEEKSEGCDRKNH